MRGVWEATRGRPAMRWGILQLHFGRNVRTFVVVLGQLFFVCTVTEIKLSFPSLLLLQLVPQLSLPLPTAN
jgi:predicted small integral membrane protein